MSTTKLLCFILIISVLVSCEKNPVDSQVYQPLAFKDSWPVSTAQQQGMDHQMLMDGYKNAEDQKFIYSLLVIKNGYLIAEKYFNRYHPFMPANLKSVTKSFLSALIGIAFREGYLNNLDQKILDFFPEYVYSSIDQRKYDITLRHLLTMRMGIEHEEECLFEIMSTPDWVKTTIEYPLIYDPGTRFVYNSMETHLLSAILTRATGMSTLEFANTHLFAPLGIQVAYWMQDPQGYFFGGSEMFITPRDMAKLGVLYLNNGIWKGEQIVPKSWIEETMTYTFGPSTNPWGDFHEYSYGYLWWLGKISNQQMYMALGHGGQYIIIFPDLELIVVVTSYPPDSWDTDGQELSVLNIVATYVLPAVRQ